MDAVGLVSVRFERTLRFRWALKRQREFVRYLTSISPPLSFLYALFTLFHFSFYLSTRIYAKRSISSPLYHAYIYIYMYIVCRNCADNCKKTFFVWRSEQHVRLTLSCINCSISYQGCSARKTKDLGELQALWRVLRGLSYKK